MNTFDFNVDWSEDKGAMINQFKEQIGENEFKQANKKYNDMVNSQINDLITSKDFSGLPEEEKQKQITDIKRKAKDDIFDEYKFRYRKPRTR
jgi:hypothetical protein